MSLSFLRAVIRAWERWRFHRSLPRQSPEAHRIADRIAKATRCHKSRRHLRLELARQIAGVKQ